MLEALDTSSAVEGYQDGPTLFSRRSKLCCSFTVAFGTATIANISNGQVATKSFGNKN